MMITVLKKGTSQAQMEHLIAWLRGQNLDVHISQGEDYTVLGLIGDTGKIDMDLLGSLDIVESVKRITDPFKQCNRQFHPEDTVITVGNAKIGGGHFALIRFSAWRCFQATHLSVRFPGLGGRGYPTASAGEKGNGSSHRDRNYERKLS